MANTTFSGPVRSENGFQSITKSTTTGDVTVEATYDTRPNFRVSVDNTTFNTGTAVTATLTTAQSGTIFEVDGTGIINVNMPALSTANVGTTYEFIVTTAVGAGTTDDLRASRRWCVELLWCADSSRRCGGKPGKRRCWGHADAGKLDCGQQPREAHLHLG
jgi:hypothetical protein